MLNFMLFNFVMHAVPEYNNYTLDIETIPHCPW